MTLILVNLERPLSLDTGCVGPQHQLLEAQATGPRFIRALLNAPL